MFPEVWQALETTYGALIEIYSLDAGFCAQANARLIAAAHQGYLLGLKGNQPELCREAERVLASRTDPERSSAWESYQGDQLRSHLDRTTEMAGYLDWSHLQQVWRVEKAIRKGTTGRIEHEHRDYVTKLHRGRLKPAQILVVVRAHWAIEHHGHWTVDVIWDEDSKVWCGQTCTGENRAERRKDDGRSAVRCCCCSSATLLGASCRTGRRPPASEAACW